MTKSTSQERTCGVRMMGAEEAAGADTWTDDGFRRRFTTRPTTVPNMATIGDNRYVNINSGKSNLCATDRPKMFNWRASTCRSSSASLDWTTTNVPAAKTSKGPTLIVPGATRSFVASSQTVPIQQLNREASDPREPHEWADVRTLSVSHTLSKAALIDLRKVSDVDRRNGHQRRLSCNPSAFEKGELCEQQHMAAWNPNSVWRRRRRRRAIPMIIERIITLVNVVSAARGNVHGGRW